MDSDTRRNLAAYYANFIVLAVVGLLVNPLLLGALGPTAFGVWKSLQRYLDFATVADGRAAQALKWIVASRVSLSQVERRRDVGAALIVWLRWLPAAIVVAVGLVLATPLLIKGLPEPERHLAYTAAAILAANTVLAGLLSLPDSVLIGVNQGYKSMVVTTGAFVLSNVAMVGAASAGWPLWSLAIVVLAAAVLNAGLTLVVAKRAVPWWGVSRPSAADVRRVHGYSAWTIGWVVVDKLFLTCELIVISVMVGAVAVAQYTFTTFVMQFVLSIALVTASGFTPKLGALLGAARITEAAELAVSVRHLVVGVAVLGSGAVLAFNGAFVQAWVGSDHYLGSTLNALLVVCALQLALIRVDGQILDVTMRIAPKVLVGLLSSVGGIAAGCLAYALTHRLDVALIAIILARLLSNVVYPLLVGRVLPHARLPRRAITMAGVALAASFAVGAVSATVSPLVLTALAVTWVAAAVIVSGAGLLPRQTIAALLRRGSVPESNGA